MCLLLYYTYCVSVPLSIQSEVVDHVMVESPEIYTRRKETAAMLEVRVSTYLSTVNYCMTCQVGKWSFAICYQEVVALCIVIYIYPQAGTSGPASSAFAGPLF